MARQEFFLNVPETSAIAGSEKLVCGSASPAAIRGFSESTNAAIPRSLTGVIWAGSRFAALARRLQ
jgi:hypothetical protein